MRRQESRLEKPDQERRRRLQMAYSESIPLDLLREEQQCIGTEIAQAEKIKAGRTAQRDVLQRSLAIALADCRAGDLIRNPEDRKSLDQAVWERLWVVDDEILGGDLATPFRQTHRRTAA